MKVKKFVNNLTDRLVELVQIQNPANLNEAITAASSAEIEIKCKNR